MGGYQGRYCRAILNAVPLWAFVMDGDMRLRDLNDAALARFGPGKAGLLRRRGGEVLRCLQSSQVPDGCGHAPACRSCVIRRAVMESVEGGSVLRRPTSVELSPGGDAARLELLITANPMPDSEEPLAILVVEDVSEEARLREIVPICAKCKRVRCDDGYWHSVETYFNEHAGVVFSHGLCPNCADDLYSDLAADA